MAERKTSWSFLLHTNTLQLIAMSTQTRAYKSIKWSSLSSVKVSRENGFRLVILILLVPALFINLDIKSFTEDESLRSLVALEMIYSDNFITPTLNGSYYYNKPPLWNWILASAFMITGEPGEGVARSMTVLSLLVYALLVYLSFRRYFSERTGFVAALAVITCGRFLFWDSMLALIDTFYSLVVFLQWIVIYEWGRKQKYLTLILLSYLLTAAGVMLKGLPSLAFQAISLLVFFIDQRKFSVLLSWKHFTGILLLFSVLGIYYYSYFQVNPNLLQAWVTLYDQSAMRTPLEVGMWDTVKHLFTFPVYHIYQFFPWTFLLILLVKRKNRVQVLQHPFSRYALLMGAANLVIYWVSPQVYPRYLLMFLPLLFGPLIYLYSKEKNSKGTWVKRVEIVFLSGMIALTILPLAAYFEKDISVVSYWPFITWASVLLLGAVTLVYIRFPSYRLHALIIFLLIARITFNLLVLPVRTFHDKATLNRATTIEAAEAVPDAASVFIYQGINREATSYTNSFYFTRELGKVVTEDSASNTRNGLYIVDPFTYPEATLADTVAKYRVRHQKRYFLIGHLAD